MTYQGIAVTASPSRRTAARLLSIKTLPAHAAIALSLLVAASAAAQNPFAANIRPSDPLSPAEQQKTFQLPPGFSIQLVASEPDILKPLNMAFDGKGRLWITETTEYPYPAPPNRPGRDSIKVLEDTDGDGRADKITPFAEGLNVPMGIYPFADGVIAFSIPNIWRFRDTDGDGRSDQREKLYGPMGYERDTHGLNNAFRRGFDGWLYACHGFNNDTTVQGADGHTIHMQSGNTYRMRLDGSRIEQFTWGQVNPFGMTFDGLFNVFTADCHSRPIYQLLRGGYYPSFGKPHDGLGFVQSMMEHLHGSTAISGVACYTDERFPEPFRGNMFSGNVMTSRINRDLLAYHGSTILARQEPDFVSTTDPWFRPVDIQVGPDGALYIADFYNRIIGHYEVPLDHPGRDRHRGRIWRVSYDGDGPTARPARRPLDLTTASPTALVAALDDVNLGYSMLAMHQLVDRAGKSAIDEVRAALRAPDRPRVRSRAIWILHRLGALRHDELAKVTQDKDRAVRVHAQKLLSEISPWTDQQRALALAALDDHDAFVRRAAADALGRHQSHQSLRPLLDALAAAPREDNHLRHVIRMALRNHLLEGTGFDRLRTLQLSDEDRRAIASICLAVQSPQAGSFLLEHLRVSEENETTTGNYLRHAARHMVEADTDRLVRFAQERYARQIDHQWSLLESIQTGLEQRGATPSELVKQWARDLAKQLFDSIDADSRAWVNSPVDGRTASANPWVLQRRRSADGDDQSQFLSSLPLGERLTGRLRSPTFTIPSRLRFYVAGHLGFPDGPLVALNFVRLRDASTGRLLTEARPPRDDTAQPVDWQLDQYAGKQGYLEIVDGDPRGAYAWLAVGRFDPAVVALPSVDPSTVVRRQQAAARLVSSFQMRDLERQLIDLAKSQNAEIASRAAAVRAMIALQPDVRLSALAAIVGDPTVAGDLREDIVRAVMSREQAIIENTLRKAFQVVSVRPQVTMAQVLARDRLGATSLLGLVEAGHASVRLLQNGAISASLAAVQQESDLNRVNQLRASIPPASQRVDALLRRRIRRHRVVERSIQRGAQVFTRVCAACHQIDGQGELVGPQLDGIGNRGLERLMEDTLDPNRNVDVAFRTTMLQLNSGKVLTGLFRRYEGASMVLVDNQGKEFTVPTDEIDQQSRSHVSLMPENYDDTITEDQFHDLLAFLMTKVGDGGGKSSSEADKK